jgi:hypothetical protein
VYAATGKTPQPHVLAAGSRAAPGLGDVPPGLRAMIARCLRPDPAQRATLTDVIAECGHPGSPMRSDWLPQSAAAFVRNRAVQQRSNVTTLLGARKLATPRPAGAPGQSRRTAGQRYRALSARVAAASERWPLVRQPSLRRWSGFGLLLSVVTLAEVVSRTPLAQDRASGQLRWLPTARSVQATVEQFTSWLPDPVAAWSRSAGSAAAADDRLAAVTAVLVVLLAVARRVHRARAHQVAVKAAAVFAADTLLVLLALRLVQTGFDPLIHIAAYLQWWAVAALAAAVALVYPAAGRVRLPGVR